MLKNILNFFSKQEKKRLFIVDGDGCTPHTWVYEDVLGTSEVYVVRHTQSYFSKPKILDAYPEIIDVPLTGYRTSKETVDKYIGLMIQKAVSDGYRDINIVSRDCDMIDMARMLIDINPDKKFTINIIMPNQKTLAKGTDLNCYRVGDAKMSVYLVKQKSNARVGFPVNHNDPSE